MIPWKTEASFLLNLGKFLGPWKFLLCIYWSFGEHFISPDLIDLKSIRLRLKVLNTASPSFILKFISAGRFSNTCILPITGHLISTRFMTIAFPIPICRRNGLEPKLPPELIFLKIFIIVFGKSFQHERSGIGLFLNLVQNKSNKKE